MRKQFYKTLENIVSKTPNVIVLLGDIGVFGCRNIFKNFPNQIINVGVCEQTMISMAAGLAKSGFIPIVHTIAPFIIERGLEQIKLDIGYQNLPVKLVSIGASYDYASLGTTHHCPGDIAIMKTIPNIDIIVPGNAKEFENLFIQTYSTNKPTYYRLSDYNHSHFTNVFYNTAEVIKSGKKATIIVIGNLLTNVVEATKNLDVTVLYYTTVTPFDTDILKFNYNSHKFIIIEPFFEGTLTYDVVNAFPSEPIIVRSIGVARLPDHHYGKKEDHDRLNGLTITQLENKIKQIIC
jgi:transketolase